MALHFVGFKNDRYWNAVKVWGLPDFYHRRWDKRAQLEIVAGDVAIFAKGNEHDKPHVQSFDDSEWLNFIEKGRRLAKHRPACLACNFTPARLIGRGEPSVWWCPKCRARFVSEPIW